MKEYDAWIEEVKNDLIKQYDKMGLRASGKWAKSLESKAEVLGVKNVLTITGEKYTGVLVDGRRPNKNSSKEAIKAWVGYAGSTFLKDWVRDKNLNISPFAVAYKIARKGIPVPNSFNSGDLISAVMNKGRIDSLKTLIGAKYMVDIKTTILNEYK